jgi:hypothetical protein
MKAANDWTIGNTVRVGFMVLKVIEKVPTPRNGLPDQYVLTDAMGERFYRFTPYNGLDRCASLMEARVIL